MHACNPKAAAGQVQCADPADVNRNGKPDNPAGQLELEGTSVGERGPGVNRGVMGLEVHTMMSKRIKYIEPYGGFSALFEFQQASSDYGISDVEATLVNHPPLVGTMILGMMVIPWENREKFGRLTFDMRLTGQYHSQGRDYSELFDAIGSSDAASVRTPQWAAYKATVCDPKSTALCPPSVVDTGSQKTYFTGLSDVAAYTSFRISGSATWQTNEYVKFNFGLGYRHDQGHSISVQPREDRSGDGRPLPLRRRGRHDRHRDRQPQLPPADERRRAPLLRRRQQHIRRHGLRRRDVLNARRGSHNG